MMGVFIINIFKRLAMVMRLSVKFIVIVVVSILLIISAIVLFYKPTYAVYLNDELIGYTSDKSGLQAKINTYMESGDSDGVAFAQIDSVPEYELCLLKKGIVTNEDEIYAKVTENGTKYYKYYAITDDKKEKYYLENFKDAEKVIQELKEKDSNNQSDLAIVEKYDTKTKKFTSVEKCVAGLYEEKPQVITYASTSYGDTVSSGYTDLGISFVTPTTGIITSRFGSRESIRSSGHRGIDIAGSTGTPIKAVATGTVVTSTYNSSYGYYIRISHGNGVETLYAHCSQLLVSVGDTVSQGQVIAKMGSTGNSTGPHLHLEVSKNGVLYNPQNYVY